MKFTTVKNANNLFGIANEKMELVVPCEHLTKEDAIDEWQYFQFFNSQLTSKGIEQIVEDLLSQKITII